MLDAIVDYFNERKFMKQLNKEPFDFDANLEMPNPEDLARDIVAATPRPVIKVIPNELAESLPANAVAVDRSGVLKRLLRSESEEAFIPAGCLTKKILSIPELNIILVSGYWAWVDIPEDVLPELSNLSRCFKMASIGDKADASNLLLPPETAKQLWDMDQMMLVFSSFSAGKYNDENITQTAAARTAAQRIPYLVKDRNVRTVRANLKMGDKGFRVTLL